MPQIPIIDWIRIFAPSKAVTWADNQILIAGIPFDLNSRKSYGTHESIRAIRNEFGWLIEISGSYFSNLIYSDNYDLDRKKDVESIWPYLEKLKDFNVSRLDLAYDLSTDLDLSTIYSSSKSTINNNVYKQGNQVIGRTFGNRGAEYVFCRIYRKDFCHFDSREKAVERFGTDDFTRCEFEIGRKKLVSFGINKVADLMTKMKGDYLYELGSMVLFFYGICDKDGTIIANTDRYKRPPRPKTIDSNYVPVIEGLIRALIRKHNYLPEDVEIAEALTFVDEPDIIVNCLGLLEEIEKPKVRKWKRYSQQE